MYDPTIHIGLHVSGGREQLSVQRKGGRRSLAHCCLQATCAAQSVECGVCCACNALMGQDSCRQIASSPDLSHLARALAVLPPEDVLQTAQDALGFLTYQQQLLHAKWRQDSKSQLKKMTSQSQEKIAELHLAAQKVSAKHDPLATHGGTDVGMICSAQLLCRRLRSSSRQCTHKQTPQARSESSRRTSRRKHGACQCKRANAAAHAL